jgi:hypothetical protein
MSELYLHSPIRFTSVMHKYLSTETTSSYYIMLLHFSICHGLYIYRFCGLCDGAVYSLRRVASNNRINIMGNELRKKNGGNNVYASFRT